MSEPILEKLTTEFVASIDQHSVAFELLLRAGELAALCDEPPASRVQKKIRWAAVDLTTKRIQLLLNKFSPSAGVFGHVSKELIDKHITKLITAKAQGGVR